MATSLPPDEDSASGSFSVRLANAMMSGTVKGASSRS